MEKQKNKQKNVRLIGVSPEIQAVLFSDLEHFQKTIGDGEWNFSNVIAEYKKIINTGVGSSDGTKHMECEDSLILKEPVKSLDPQNYSAILEDANGTIHYWLKDGTYDGHDSDCDCKNELKELWLNIFPDNKKHFVNDWTYDTKEQADKEADPSRIACVRVPYQKGDGLK